MEAVNETKTIEVVNWWIYKKHFFTYEVCFLDTCKNGLFTGDKIFQRNNFKKFRNIKMEICPFDKKYIIRRIKIKKKYFKEFENYLRQITRDMILLGNKEYEKVCLAIKNKIVCNFLYYINEEKGVNKGVLHNV